MSAEEVVERHQQFMEHIHFCTIDLANLLLGHLKTKW
jgi:hypothetical protein